MTKPILLAFWVLAFMPSSLWAAEKFPSVITGVADFTEGDLEKSRNEAIEAGLKQAVENALRTEVGQGALDDNAATVRSRFINSYRDFIKRSGTLATKEDGFRLRVTIGYEIDREKLKARLAAVKLSQTEVRPSVLLVWSVEDKEATRNELPAEGAVQTQYVAASWMEGATTPAAATALAEGLSQNGLTVTPLTPELQRWMAQTLAGNEVSKSFLRALAAEARLDAVVYLRVVHRRLPGPPASNLMVERVHNVAFIVDGDTGDFIGSPVATPQIRIAGGGQQVGQDWVNRVLNSLITEQGRETLLVFRGVTSMKQYDSIWATVRKLTELGDVVPRKLDAKQVEFTVTAEAAAALDAVRKAFPKAEASREANQITLTLPATDAK
jgi:hypothetical protein